MLQEYNRSLIQWGKRLIFLGLWIREVGGSGVLNFHNVSWFKKKELIFWPLPRAGIWWMKITKSAKRYRVILLTGPPLFNVQCYYEKSQLANQRLSQMKWMDIQLSSPSNHLHTFVIMPLFGSSLNIKNWFEKFSVYSTKRKAYNWFCSFCPGTKGES